MIKLNKLDMNANAEIKTLFETMNDLKANDKLYTEDLKFKLSDFLCGQCTFNDTVESYNNYNTNRQQLVIVVNSLHDFRLGQLTKMKNMIDPEVYEHIEELIKQKKAKILDDPLKYDIFKLFETIL